MQHELQVRLYLEHMLNSTIVEHLAINYGFVIFFLSKSSPQTILNISEKPMQIVSSVFPENYSKLLAIKFCA